MVLTDLQSVIEPILSAHFEQAVQLRLETITGGDIHQSFKADLGFVAASSQTLFIKVNSADHSAILHSEYQSLKIVSALGLNYPEPIFFTQNDTVALLVMALHDFMPISPANAGELGVMLAQQHQLQGDAFGWDKNNYIGLTPQQNTVTENWADFYCDNRLRPQLSLAKRRGLDNDLFTQISHLFRPIHRLLSDHNPKPCLLHGDLWAGNAGFDQITNKVMLFDPAPYYGDPETDLAMTELFGGFSSGFYENYNNINSLEAEYSVRKPIYHLYHALNHFNLFGVGYLPMIKTLIEQIETKIG